jgi:hypothetical protein
MQVGGHATNEPVIAWWLDAKGVGESLRERYQVPEKLTPKLLKLVSKLDAIEGNQLSRYSGSRRDYEQWLEARIAVKPFPDWFVLT